MASERYFIDKRIGCIAIVDREHPDYDPSHPGIEPGTCGVVWYEHGLCVQDKCPTCHRDRSGGWALAKGAIERAEQKLAELMEVANA